MTVKIIVLLAILLSAPSVTATTAASPEPTGEGTHVVIGMLEELDIPKMSGKIKTDLGQTVPFRMVRPDLFKGLSVGERIAVRLNDQGQVIRVMDTTVPELPSPEK
ncbi:MAG TPA: hypothetical protein VES92_03180 [Nitrospiraceae bacterium]|nr:hypothetical protein [Nitrospiraceae bacterium]